MHRQKDSSLYVVILGKLMKISCQKSNSRIENMSFFAAYGDGEIENNDLHKMLLFCER